MKTIVTHLSPDLDAIASCWLIKKYLTDWDSAEIRLVPAGTTLNNEPPDDNKEIIHGKQALQGIFILKICVQLITSGPFDLLFVFFEQYFLFEIPLLDEAYAGEKI